MKQMFRFRKASLPLRNLQLSQVDYHPQTEYSYNHANPLQRCSECQNYQSRCYRCSHRIMECLKSNFNQQKVRLLSPTKVTPKIEPGEKQQIYKVANMTIRKIKDKGNVLTFQQPVLHRNTILYNANQQVLNKSRSRSAKAKEEKKQRSLLINFNYISQKMKGSGRLRPSSVSIESIGKEMPKVTLLGHSSRRKPSLFEMQLR